MSIKRLMIGVLVAALALAGLGVFVATSVNAQDTPAGWLGVAVRDTDDGVVITQVAPDSPADAAGLTAGAVISAVNGTAITSGTQLSEVIAGYAPGTVVTVLVVEDGAERGVEVTLGERPADAMPSAGMAFGFAPGMLGRMNLMGLELDLTDAGLTIVAIDAESPLAEAGFQAGDVITAINGEPVSDLLHGQFMQTLRTDAPVVFTIQRGDEEVTLEVDLGDVMDFGFGMVDPAGPLGPMNGVVQSRPTQLGVNFRTLTPEIAAEEGLAVEEGALISEVYEGTPAATTGLQAGDIVLAVAGDVVDQERTLADRLLAYEENDVVTLTVLRGEEELTLEVTLGPRVPGYGMGIISGMDVMPGMQQGMPMAPGMQQGTQGYRFGGRMHGHHGGMGSMGQMGPMGGMGSMGSMMPNMGTMPGMQTMPGMGAYGYGGMMPDMQTMPGMGAYGFGGMMQGMMPDNQTMPGMGAYGFGGMMEGMTPDQFLEAHPFMGQLFELLPDGSFQFHMTPDATAPDTTIEVVPAVPGTSA